MCALVAATSAVSKFGAQTTKFASQNNKFGGRPVVAHHGATTDDANAEVTHYAADVRADGFQYAFDTTNAIHAAASGNANGDINGDFSWISPEGEQVVLQYVADENGYQPDSALLPTPPPIPAAILKSLEYIRTHPSYEEPAKGFAPQAVRKVAQKAAKKTTGRRF